MKKIILPLVVFGAMSFIACGDDDENLLSCAEASAKAATLLNELPTVNPNDYADKCASYKQSLENWKTACGDPNGAIQTTIDELDCSSIPAN